jgi:hypothetical protein
VLLVRVSLVCMQGRASNMLLDDRDLSRYYEEHTAELAKAAAAAMAAVFAGVMNLHLQPLLPEGHAAAVAASNSAAAAAALSRQLPPPLQQFAAADALLSGTLDDRWTRWTEQQREEAWRGWVDEHVWGKPPPPPPSSSTAAAAGTSSRYTGRPPGPPNRGPADSSRPYEQQEPRGYGSSRGGSSGVYDSDRPNGANEALRDRERDRDRDRDRNRDRDRGRGYDRERDHRDRGRDAYDDDRGHRAGRYQEPDSRDDRKRQRR